MTNPITQPQRFGGIAPPGSLLKRPRSASTKGYKAPPPTAGRGTFSCVEHLAAIRQLPCLKCGLEPAGEAAHVRMSSAAFGKRQGLGSKPGDEWTVPLDPACHTRDPDSLHKIGEAEFWHRLGMNPLLIAQELASASPDLVRMRAIVFKHIAERKS